MQMNVNEEKKMVMIWLTNAEKNDPVIRENLKPLNAEYKKKKYFVAVFESGEKDLNLVKRICIRVRLIFLLTTSAAVPSLRYRERKRSALRR